ncbi:MAG TPA: peptide-methionine (S)-S-oxide reductase MsrA [Saprospiraceae bacterium]|nr:peptide-methionine (S)-S-oxide reductase MsrA [Saprospiraceae bacterium]
MKFLFLIASFFLNTCVIADKTKQMNTNMQDQSTTNISTEVIPNLNDLDTASFGAGCFWCVEAVFQNFKGVIKVQSGYMGGDIKNPSYREVCTGTTGHAEICQITFDPNQISYAELLEILWVSHDPTTLNRQGNDKGTQYRSVIFYHNLNQKEIAEKSKREVAPNFWKDPIVTEISKASEFYVAEDYHQNYYNDNSDAMYCQYIISPKIQKIKEKYANKLK